MTNCFILEIPIKSSVFDDLKATTVSPFVYAVFPSPDVYMEGAMCIRLIRACKNLYILSLALPILGSKWFVYYPKNLT